MILLRVRARPVMAAALLLVVCVLAASYAAAFEVQACVPFSVPCCGEVYQISDDPNNCAAGDKIDPISVKFSFTGAVTTASPVIEAVAGPLVLAKHLNQSSPPLFLAAMNGRTFSTVLIVIFDRGAGAPRGARLFSILLKRATVSSLEDSAQDSRLTTAGPLESATFAYELIELRDDTTGTTRCWSFFRNLEDCAF